MGELDEVLTQLGMELDENNAMQKEARASDELIGIMIVIMIKLLRTILWLLRVIRISYY